MSDETACQCACHVSSGTHRSCNLDAGHGVGCGPHELAPEEACALVHPKPTERFVGMLCKRHYHWIDSTLKEILELFALLPDVLIPGPGGDGRGGKQIYSPAPGRLDVMVLTDPRNGGVPIPMSPYLNADGRGGLEDNGPDSLDIPGTLFSWVRVLLEERWTSGNAPETDGTVTGSICLLRRERHWIAAQAWVDDYADELTSIHRALARGVGDSMWPKPIGNCPNCGAALYNTIGIDEVTCRRCKSAWAGKALLRLRLILEQEAQRGKSERATEKPPIASAS